MERNPTDDMGTSGTSSTSGMTGSDSLGVTGLGSGQDAASGAFAGTTSDMNGASQSSANDESRVDQMKDMASDRLGQAKDMASERLGQAKEKATQLKATLADRLESGANALRERAQSGANGGGAQLAGAGAAGGTVSGLLDSDQVQRLAGPAADAMQKTADFLRDGDMREALEEQVRTNPARTLLIALGVGYVLGKALRR